MKIDDDLDQQILLYFKGWYHRPIRLVVEDLQTIFGRYYQFPANEISLTLITEIILTLCGDTLLSHNKQMKLLMDIDPANCHRTGYQCSKDSYQYQKAVIYAIRSHIAGLPAITWDKIDTRKFDPTFFPEE